MSEYSLNGESIECNRSEIITRKHRLNGLIKVPNVGPCIKIDCNLNSSAEIKEELSPKECVYKENSNLNLGDIIKCSALYILHKGLKPIKFSKINYSGRHKAQQGYTKGFTYAEIKIPLQNVINSIENRRQIKEQ